MHCYFSIKSARLNSSLLTHMLYNGPTAPPPPKKTITTFSLIELEAIVAFPSAAPGDSASAGRRFHKDDGCGGEAIRRYRMEAERQNQRGKRGAGGGGGIYLFIAYSRQITWRIVAVFPPRRRRPGVSEFRERRENIVPLQVSTSSSTKHVRYVQDAEL